MAGLPHRNMMRLRSGHTGSFVLDNGFDALGFGS
jgi:hypothetical protein